ncbi:MAG: hypothetical protein ACXWCY_25240 [Burkholderiales bacterium]
MDVGLIWNDHHNLSIVDVSTVAERLVKILAGRVPDLDAHLTIAYPEPGWKDLPKQIAAAFVSRPAWLTRSFWDFSRLGAVPHVRDIVPRVQQILDEKQRKIPGYRSYCDEVWLLIVADGSTMQSYVVVDENDDLSIHDLVSSFDRAYFLSVTHQRVVELSLSRPS